MTATVARRTRWLLPSLLVLVGCRDVGLPAPPDAAQPGSLSGRAMVAQPGRGASVAAPRAHVELLGTGLSTVADDQGYFRLDGILRTGPSQLLLSADLDGDGVTDRQRLLDLGALAPGPGKQLSVGEVELVQSGLLRGQALRDDVPGKTGHAGTLVFVPEGPFTTTTSDDGSFLLGQLPEGAFSVAYFRAGYLTQGPDRVVLSSGQALTLQPVRLTPLVATPASVGLQGRVVLADGGAATGAVVSLQGLSPPPPTLVDAQGGYAFSGLSQGVYTLLALAAGSRVGVVSNLLLLEGTRTLADLVLLPGATGDAGVVEAPDGGGDAGTASHDPVGQTPRVRIVTFGGGHGCPWTGYLLQSGLDLDGSGVLDASEVVSTQVVCQAPSLDIAPAGPALCPWGGVVLTTWVDANLDGAFQPAEALTDPPPVVLCRSAPTFAVSGQVRGVGGQAVGLAVSGDAVASGQTDDAGVYRVGGLRSGTYTVTPSLAGTPLVPTSRVVVVDGGDVQGVDFASAGLGCAAGVRQGFLDVNAFLGIAACAGTWSGDVATAGALCATGFHVCRGNEPVFRTLTYGAASAFPGCFPIDAAQDNGVCVPGCSTSTADQPANLDMGGVGSGCGWQFSGQTGCMATGRIDASENSGTGCSYTSGYAGVACCSD